MGFVPIELHRFAQLHVKNNRGESLAEVTKLLQEALKDYKAGVRCQCGEPISVIGSAWVGNACFTCITGEAYPESDYEITGACDKVSRRSPRATAPSR